MNEIIGGFTLPGEAGYEQLTLELAKKWGADVIRDSDGTELSREILDSGYGIYSTVCVIRDHNGWAKHNMDKLQQTFLGTLSRVAEADELQIFLLEDYSKEQFQVNDTPEAMKYWQVFDRTANRELPKEQWEYNKESQSVILHGIAPWHSYSVSFLAYRIWEEISMYNHITNNWNKEHLMQIDPRYPEVQEYLLKWMENWCTGHPDTTVVRFTSMFYNFVWIWGSNDRHKNCFTDWGSYDFTVSEYALDLFAEKYGYRLTAEDFVNQGKLHASHMPVNKRKKDWMQFVNEFVIDFGKKLIDIVHAHGKLAYVFYDDSWVGIEPYNGHFEEFGFDGIIKCVFNGFETRLCADVPVETHEIRLHPYLFPTGLGGSPTFSPGGDPTRDAREYWVRVRRALLRKPVDRIGLGGYLHLTEGYPDFVDYIEQIGKEFREIVSFHKMEKPVTETVCVAVLHRWGKMRSWTLSGHFHETDKMDLIHVNEALSGFPVKVSFIDFEDIEKKDLSKYQVIINAGFEGSAWSGGDVWTNERLIEKLTKWVYDGGTFLGIGESSATEGYEYRLRMAHILGVDTDNGERFCHGRWKYEIEAYNWNCPKEAYFEGNDRIYLIDGKTKVLFEDQKKRPSVTYRSFGKGCGIYLAQFRSSWVNNRILYNLITHMIEEKTIQVIDNVNVECAVFAESKKIIVVNNADTEQQAKIRVFEEEYCVSLEPSGYQVIDLHCTE